MIADSDERTFPDRIEREPQLEARSVDFDPGTVVACDRSYDPPGSSNSVSSA